MSRNCHCNTWINKEDLYSPQADTSEQWSIPHYPLLWACLILCAILSKNIPDWCLCALLMMFLWNVLHAKPLYGQKQKNSPSCQFSSPTSALVSDKKADVLSWAKYHLVSYLFTYHPLGAEMNCVFITCFVLCLSPGW